MAERPTAITATTTRRDACAFVCVGVDAGSPQPVLVPGGDTTAILINYHYIVSLDTLLAHLCVTWSSHVTYLLVPLFITGYFFVVS